VAVWKPPLRQRVLEMIKRDMRVNDVCRTGGITLTWTSQNQFAHAKPQRRKGTKLADAILGGLAALREIFAVCSNFWVNPLNSQ
jgi:hypothetical protein